MGIRESYTLGADNLGFLSRIAIARPRSEESLSPGQVKSESDRVEWYAGVLHKSVRSGRLRETVHEPSGVRTGEGGFFLTSLN